MRAAAAAAVTIALVPLASGCASRVMVPPLIDLHPYEIVGVIEFAASSEEGDLAAYTTRRFVEEMRRDQGIVRTLDLGTEERALASVGADRLDARAYRRLGDEHNATTILRGRLEISDIRPAIRIATGFNLASVAADVDAKLNAELIETATGASIWSASATATRRVGEVTMIGPGRFVLDADDPENAYGDLIEALVREVTLDFQVTWTRGDR